MLTVIETQEFMAWSALVWSDAEREAFIDWIADHPEAGDVIPGSGGLRKVRWSRAGVGKRGGARVIYYLQASVDRIYLVYGYVKAKQEVLTPQQLKVLAELMKEIDNG